MRVKDHIALPPGSVVGIFGGGQLGRMMAVAAARMGYHAHIYSDEMASPAIEVSRSYTIASYADEERLKSFAQEVDVATYEFENIPVNSLREVQKLVPVYPKPGILEIAQDRVSEKDFCNKLGIPTAPYWRVTDLGTLQVSLNELGLPGLLKSTRFGYDGKNQIKVKIGDNLSDAWNHIGGGPGVLEGWMNYEREISVIVVRAQTGDVQCYDPVENEHKNYVLHRSIVPARICSETKEKAITAAKHLAVSLDLVGVLAVEMFVMKDGAIAINEMAPRPHNSGHWTIEACASSQFEQLIRCICGLPLGSCARSADAEMQNLLGDEVNDWFLYLADPSQRLHLYGKGETRVGRKMGHVTRLKTLLK